MSDPLTSPPPCGEGQGGGPPPNRPEVPLPQTESVDPRYRDLADWPPITALHALWESQMAAVAAVRPALPAIEAAAVAAATRLRQGGRLIYAGAGTSGRIGVQDGAELPPTFDWPEEKLGLLIAGGQAALTRAVENAEDRTDLAEQDIAAQNLTPNDVLITLAASGATPYALACLTLAKSQGALTIGIANSPNAPLLVAAAHPILVQTGPEPIAGSTRLKAGTSQKIVLNLLSTTIMLRLGRVWRGQMVDMVARNEKLRRRAVRMVRTLTNCTEQAAQDALAQSGGKTKQAILLLQGFTPDEATSRLTASDGHLGRALAAPQ